MLDDENRAFFLNELDGFETNNGVAVLATTNHPDKLDPAILDRPSRFDRKYFFDLPAGSERLAYITFWNQKLQPELRLSEKASLKVVGQTEGFSFAYLKELFLSSMMQWVTHERTSMDEVVLAEIVRLRGQMPGASPADEAVERRGLFAKFGRSSNGSNKKV